MGLEIERKFLVKDDRWKNAATGTNYQQGYLSSHRERTVRVRTIQDKAYLTIKGLNQGASRLEYEYEIPYQDAVEILTILCEKPIIEKVRYKILYEGLTLEIDEFEGENQGLIVAEVELITEDQAITLPPWVGTEVTGQAKYYNSSLIKNPYSQWV